MATDAVEALGAWTYVLVAAVVVLETTVGLGIFAPGEVLIAVSGAAAATGLLDPALLVLVVVACGIAGDSASWALGRRHGVGTLVRVGARVGIGEPRVLAVRTRIATSGGWVLVAGRFVGPVRVVAPYLCGAGGMRFATFLPYDAAGISVWAGTYLGVGFAFGGALEAATGRVAQVGLAVLLAALAATFVARRVRGGSAVVAADRAPS